MLERFIIWVTTLAASHAVKKIQRTSRILHGSTYPIILVAGNIGKSTLTLLVSQLIQNSGLNVVTGTTIQKNYNTPLGILKTLYAASSYPQLILKILLGQHIRPEKGTYLVFELGVDEYGGASRYTRIFSDIDYLLMAGLGAEHTGGFPRQVDSQRSDQILQCVPDKIINQLQKLQNLVIKNVILEQLYLIRFSKHILLPSTIGQLGNEILFFQHKDKPIQHTSSVDLKQSTQYINGTPISHRYYVPDTFGVFYSLLACLQQKLELDPQALASTFGNMQLPNGRFGRFAGKPPYEYIIDSTYNSDPLSLSGFLDTLESTLVSHPNHTVILGEMRELGEQSYSEHKAILDRIDTLPSTVSCILVGKEWKKIANSRPTFDTPGEALRLLESMQVQGNSWLWCKGSQNTIFLEEIVKTYLANPDDIQYLCRQDITWLKRKKPFYQ